MAIIRYPVDLTYPQAGGPGVNVWHIRTNSDEPDFINDEVAAAGAAIEEFYNGWSTWRSGTTFFGGEAIEVDTEGGPGRFVNAPAWSVTGGTGSDYLPALLAATVTWRTSVASRSGRGRTFCGPLRDSALESNGTLSTPFRTALSGAAAALIAESELINDWAVGVFSRVDNVIRDFTAFRVRDSFSYLSSRRD